MTTLKWTTNPYGEKMINYDDITAVNEQLKICIDAERDNREMVRETHNFLDKQDGQWEPDILQAMQRLGQWSSRVLAAGKLK